MTRPLVQDILLYALAYALWVASVVACVVAVIELRAAINVLWGALGRSRYTLGLADQLVLLVGGLIAFVYVTFLEGYYRRSITYQVDETKPDAPLSTPPRQSRLGQWLARAGLDVLLRRFAVTLAAPLGLLLVSRALTELAWLLMR